jgi:2-haloacid dehalogenase
VSDRAGFDPAAIQALIFDVFGTVVDWRGTIIREGETRWKPRGIDIDWAKFADDWRKQYQPQMQRVRSGELPWTNLDALHRESLDRLLDDRGIDLAEAARDDLNRVWHRLDPWPDVVAGLTELRKRYILATMSNGNIRLMVDMARHGGLPWDAVLGAEVAKHYKPDPEAYLATVALLGLEPHEVLMVAAHPEDLDAAARCGLRTAFVPRPMEFGAERMARVIERGEAAAPRFDVVAPDFPALAVALGG